MVIKAQENLRLFLSSGWTQKGLIGYKTTRKPLIIFFKWLDTKYDPMRLLAGLIGYKTTKKLEIILFKWLDTKYNHKKD